MAFADDGGPAGGVVFDTGGTGEWAGVSFEMISDKPCQTSSPASSPTPSPTPTALDTENADEGSTDVGIFIYGGVAVVVIIAILGVISCHRNRRRPAALKPNPLSPTSNDGVRERATENPLYDATVYPGQPVLYADFDGASEYVDVNTYAAVSDNMYAALSEDPPPAASSEPSNPSGEVYDAEYDTPVSWAAEPATQAVDDYIEVTAVGDAGPSVVHPPNAMYVTFDDPKQPPYATVPVVFDGSEADYANDGWQAGPSGSYDYGELGRPEQHLLSTL